MNDTDIPTIQNKSGWAFRLKDGTFLHAIREATPSRPRGIGTVSKLCHLLVHEYVKDTNGETAQAFWERVFGKKLVMSGTIATEDDHAGTQFYLMSNTFIYVNTPQGHEVWMMRRSK